MSRLSALAILMTPGSAKGFFRAVAALSGRARLFGLLPVSLHDFPETRETARRVRETFKTSARPKLHSRLLPETWAIKLLEWQYNGLRRYFEREDVTAIVWNGMDRKRRLFAEAAGHAGRARLFAELAPLPGFLALDPCGINDANSLPREAAFYHGWAASHPPKRDWRAIGAMMTARKSKGQPARAPAPPTQLPDGPYIFAPLQVPGDSQLRYFGDWISDIETLLDTIDKAAAHLPNGWHVRIKQHPSAKTDFSALIARLPSGRCHLDDATDTFVQAENSAAVLTVNSSVGLQSFFFDRPVIVLGKAFYGFEPLVHKAASQQALDALMAKPQSLTVAHDLRAAFMRYLQEAYYIPARLKPEPCLFDGAEDRVIRAIEAAREQARAQRQTPG